MALIRGSWTEGCWSPKGRRLELLKADNGSEGLSVAQVGLSSGRGAPHALQSYRHWLRTTKFDCRSERLNIQTDYVQTTYCNRTQTHNLCSNQPRDSNHKVCSNQPTTVRTWPLTASFFNLCFLRLRTNCRRPDTRPNQSHREPTSSSHGLQSGHS